MSHSGCPLVHDTCVVPSDCFSRDRNPIQKTSTWLAEHSFPKESQVVLWLQHGPERGRSHSASTMIRCYLEQVAWPLLAFVSSAVKWAQWRLPTRMVGTVVGDVI